MSGFNEHLRRIPPTTLAVMGICILIHPLQKLEYLELEKFTMCPRQVLYFHEYYRIITSSVFHADFMHIGMNMLSTSAISTVVEKRMGTLRHAFSILWAILLTGFIYLISAWAVNFFLGYDELLYLPSVGFSGIIFHMLVVECNFSPSHSRSVFGFFSVPSYLYPWALLILLQVFMPNVSFLGHLAGIISGTLQYYGIFEFLLVGESFLVEMESWGVISTLTNITNFVRTPSRSASQQEPKALIRAIRRGVWLVIKFIKDSAETFFVCLFGRGHSLNSNVRFGWLSTLLSMNNSEGRGFRAPGRALDSGTDVEVVSFENEQVTRLV